MRKLKIFLASFLLIIASVDISFSYNDAQSYIKEICDDCSENGAYSSADECYDYALTYPQDGPVFSRIWVVSQYGDFIYANSANDTNKIFQRILSEPISKSEGRPDPNFRDLLFKFSITNPNNMQIKIEGIYVDVLEYYSIKNVRFEPTLMGGETWDYFCNVKPKIGSYKCMPLFHNIDYIKLGQGELESFNVSVNTVEPGIYRLGISVEYTIGGKTERFNVRNPIPDCFDFIPGENMLEDFIPDSFMPDDIRYDRLNVLVGFFNERTAQRVDDSSIWDNSSN